MMRTTFLSSAILLFVLGVLSPAFADDPSADQILSRHLNSIATDAKRKS